MGIKNGLRDLWGDRVEARAQRKERRLMKTSTWRALSAGYEDVVQPGEEQAIHEDLLNDTMLVERERWIERAQWIVLIFVAAGFGYLGSQWVVEEQAPQPWVCDVKMLGEAADEPDILRCTGGPGEVIP